MRGQGELFDWRQGELFDGDQYRRRPTHISDQGLRTRKPRNARADSEQARVIMSILRNDFKETEGP